MKLASVSRSSQTIEYQEIAFSSGKTAGLNPAAEMSGEDLQWDESDELEGKEHQQGLPRPKVGSNADI